ncbi:phosphoribosyltransferase family protein [Azorhizophilus paspali]|uniref:Phosphoribosyltransferase family protein n=1 Tax=Azorhizophilus paspali TaxID=69963 RepID=A0ABV6SMU0_AZOPA
MNFISYAALSDDIRGNLHRLHDRRIDLVVGIPRSGMIPAYMIALYLNLGCLDLESFCRNESPANGGTRSPGKPLARAWDAQTVLLVDDSIASGKSMRAAVERLPEAFAGKVIRLAVYSSSMAPAEVDLHFRHLGWPRLFEWNIYHHGILVRTCIDIDGVLCMGQTPEQNRDRERYLDYLCNAKPLILPSGRVHSIVSGRPEAYRQETEAWLEKHGIRYERLVLLGPAEHEDGFAAPCGPGKSAYYRAESGLDLFLEGDPDQALDIARATGKPVFCVGNNRIYQNGPWRTLFRNPRWLLRNTLKKFNQSMPSALKRRPQKPG